MKTTFKREVIIGNQGFVINGGKTGGGSGYSVSSAGDVNGEQKSFFLISLDNCKPSATHHKAKT
jgi:hypothetical protein